MIVGSGYDPSFGFDFVDQLVDGVTHRRYFAALPTPDDHLMKALPWRTATGITTLPRSEWARFQFQRIHSEVPILDQDGQGACVAYAGAAANMVLNARQGGSYVRLSPSFLYTLINGGRDAGANGGDCVQVMAATGVAPFGDVPEFTLRPAGYNAAAKADAQRFRITSWATITSIEEAVTAVIEGWQLLFDVRAGGSYNTDSSGVIAFLRGGTNHEQNAGEGLKQLADGSFGILNRNSWAATWGGGGGLPGGFGWITERHLDNSQTTLAVKGVVGDPADPNLPPVLV